jgi:NADPH:quinone reductase-like Zn-dependent oxidoreductase
MKAIHLKQFGIENLVLTNEKIPTPGPHQVLVRIEAVALNYLDIAIASGTYNPTIPLPRIPASDGAGIVEGIGSDVTRWKKGDRVMVNFYQKWIGGRRTAEKANSITGQATSGLLAEYACIDEEALVRTPANLTSEEAATLPIAGVTAWNGWFVHAGLRPGHTVVTQGTGGVSIFALQLARIAGARVIATSSSDHKLDTLKKLGADEVINYKKYPKWHEEVLRLTQQEGADATLDIGGAESIDSSIRSLRMEGFVGLVGFLGGPVLPVDFFRSVVYTVRMKGISVGTREDFEDLARAVEVNGLRPVISQVFPMEKVQEAFRYMQGGSHVGKVVVRVD